jgi:hypothetical protein
MKKHLTKSAACGIIEISAAHSWKRPCAARHYSTARRICQEFFEKIFA